VKDVPVFCKASTMGNNASAKWFFTVDGKLGDRVYFYVLRRNCVTTRNLYFSFTWNGSGRPQIPYPL
jgi:hypothetical protein